MLAFASTQRHPWQNQSAALDAATAAQMLPVKLISPVAALTGRVGSGAGRLPVPPPAPPQARAAGQAAGLAAHVWASAGAALAMQEGWATG